MRIRTFIGSIMIFLMGMVPLFAGERTIPVDIYVLIDKSLSMAEPGKFESMHAWVRDQLLGQILINGDRITVYQFYGRTDTILSRTIETEDDRTAVTTAIDAIRPDGQYTDIGLALDTLKRDLGRRAETDRYTVLFLLTDLKQEAPWTSRYAGSPDTFESPYLATARVLQHDAWYEITLDMDIQDRVVMTSKELYSSILETRGSEHEIGENGETSELDDRTSSGLARDDGNGQSDATVGNSPLPQYLVPVIVSIVVLAGAAGVALAVRARRERDEDKRKRV